MRREPLRGAPGRADPPEVALGREHDLVPVQRRLAVVARSLRCEGDGQEENGEKCALESHGRVGWEEQRLTYALDNRLTMSGFPQGPGGNDASDHVTPRILTAIPLAAIALAGGCSVSDSEERQLGGEYSQQINQQVPLVTDPRVTGYVSALGRQIAQRTSRGALEWQFFVVNSREVNAFALPGGFIYVNRGLIERSHTLDHLAGVLGHEIGHVVERHSVEQMKKATGTNIGLTVLCTVTSICDGTIGQVAVNLAGSALLAKYSRADEAEADSQAVVNVINAGISPAGIPEFFEVLMAERQRDPNVLEGFFASHPLEESRVQRTRTLIAAYDDARVDALPRDDRGFQLFRTIVASLPPPPSAPPRLPR